MTTAESAWGLEYMYVIVITPYMHRTTILLSKELRRDAETVARRRGISLSELIRRQLTAAVRGGNALKRASDPLFQPTHLMSADGPPDLAARHDDYLYGRQTAKTPK